MSSDLPRLLSNLIRHGTVVAVDFDAALCRVESGELTTTWIQWFTLRAGNTVTWSAPSVGERVMLLSPEGDTANAVALCGLYSDSATAPASSGTQSVTRYADGAVVRYDAETHALDAQLPSGGTFTVTADGGTTINGPLTVNGDTTVNGEAQVSGTVTADVDVIGGGKSMKGHRHTGVQGGNAVSGPPQ